MNDILIPKQFFSWTCYSQSQTLHSIHCEKEKQWKQLHFSRMQNNFYFESDIWLDWNNFDSERIFKLMANECMSRVNENVIYPKWKTHEDEHRTNKNEMKMYKNQNMFKLLSFLIFFILFFVSSTTNINQ